MLGIGFKEIYVCGYKEICKKIFIENFVCKVKLKKENRKKENK